MVPRRGARAAESARLESVCGATHRGFESHLLRVNSHNVDAGASEAVASYVSLGGSTVPASPALPALSDDEAMQLALAEARAALAHGDVPVGAVVLHNGQVIASRHNERELQNDPTAHAEVLALRDAAAVLGSWRLNEATLVVTLEPCPMCAGALLAARIPRLVFGANDPKAGACGTLYNLCADARLNHETEVVPGIAREESAKLLTDFFAAKR